MPCTVLYSSFTLCVRAEGRVRGVLGVLSRSFGLLWIDWVGVFLLFHNPFMFCLLSLLFLFSSSMGWVGVVYIPYLYLVLRDGWGGVGWRKGEADSDSD